MSTVSTIQSYNDDQLGTVHFIDLHQNEHSRKAMPQHIEVVAAGSERQRRRLQSESAADINRQREERPANSTVRV